MSFAKTVDEEELSEVSKEGGTGVQDAALAVGEGPEKKKKKVCMYVCMYVCQYGMRLRAQ